MLRSVLAPATVTHVSNPAKKWTPFTTIKSLRNLTQTPFTTDLSDYFNWTKKNIGLPKPTKSYHLISKLPIPFKNSKFKSIDSIFSISLLFDLDYSPCASNPCLHNSTCVILSTNGFQCLCSPSFIGIYCEIGNYVIFTPLIFNLTFLIPAEILNIAHFRKFSLTCCRQLTHVQVFISNNH